MTTAGCGVPAAVGVWGTDGMGYARRGLRAAVGAWSTDDRRVWGTSRRGGVGYLDERRPELRLDAADREEEVEMLEDVSLHRLVAARQVLQQQQRRPEHLLRGDVLLLQRADHSSYSRQGHDPADLIQLH